MALSKYYLVAVWEATIPSITNLIMAKKPRARDRKIKALLDRNKEKIAVAIKKLAKAAILLLPKSTTWDLDTTSASEEDVTTVVLWFLNHPKTTIPDKERAGEEIGLGGAAYHTILHQEPATLQK